jgi:hypothetical protein
MLSNWKKGIMREFGKDGYLQLKTEVQGHGNRFHEELVLKLFRPHILSIKPKLHVYAAHSSSDLTQSPLHYPCDAVLQIESGQSRGMEIESAEFVDEALSLSSGFVQRYSTYT